MLTPDNASSVSEVAVKAILGGARMIQYRDKTASPEIRAHRAQTLLAICRAYCAPLIINDDLDLALEIGADGVHLGRDDLSVADARAQAPYPLIGASCYNDFERAQAAVRAGASYVAFGSFYESATRPDAVMADVDLLARAKRELSVPVCAIGGINANNAPPLIEAGVDLLAVCSGVAAQPDMTAAVRAIATQFKND